MIKSPVGLQVRLLLVLLLLTLEELRGGVGRGPAECVQLVARYELVTEPEVGNLDVHLAVQQEVLCFQVAMNDLFLVTILNG